MARWHPTIPLGLVCFCATLGAMIPAFAKGNVLQTTLPDGLQVVIVRNALAPMGATRLVNQTGSTTAPADFPGTAHALEHMMFRGTPNLNSDQLNRIGQASGGS